MASAWDAARLASRRPLRKAYKPVAPVGVKLETASHFTDDVERFYLGGKEFGTCKGCGYHVCSCVKPSVFAQLSERVDGVRKEHAEQGYALNGSIRLIASKYIAIGKPGMFVDSARNICVGIHPHDEPEVRFALGLRVDEDVKPKPEPVQSGSLCALYQQKAELEAQLMSQAREAMQDQLRANMQRSAAYRALEAKHQSTRGKSLDGPMIDESKFMLDLQGKSGRELGLPTEPDKRQAAINLLTTGRIDPCPYAKCKLGAHHIGPCVVVDARVPPGASFLLPPSDEQLKAFNVRTCFVCNKPNTGSGAACHACFAKADAEAKPFRDALDAKIKTLMRHASRPTYVLESNPPDPEFAREYFCERRRIDCGCTGQMHDLMCPKSRRERME